MKKLLLIDGNSVLFRCYYSTVYMNMMTTSQGIPTNAVFGFINLLNKALEMIKPDLLLVAWDAGKPTFRHEKMESYKGTRKELDDELKVQMNIVREYLDDAGYTRYEQEGYEADDIIGSASKGAKDLETIILTSDKDLLQLVDDHTEVFLMKKGLQDFDEMDVKAIDAKYGLKPEQIIDLKGLMGDPSDNIPGVKGVGEKTALTLLHEYGSVENVYDHIDQIKGRRKTLLEEGRESAFLSKEMATIFTQMKLPFDLDDLEYTGEKDDTRNFYQKYEMKSLLDRRTAAKRENAVRTSTVKALPELDLTKPVYLMSVADFAPFKARKVFGFVVMQSDSVNYINARDAAADEGFKTLLKNGSIISWDAKAMLHDLQTAGFETASITDDVHLASFLLYSQATGLSELVEAAGIVLPMPLKDLEKKSLGGFTEERAIPVFSSWISQLPSAFDKAKAEMEKENLDHLYRDIELPLAFVLFDMENRGISISADILESIAKDYQAQMDELAKKIYELAGHEFNISSTKQLATVLYDELGLSSGGKKRSTAAEVLSKLADEHEIIPLIQEYRKLSKIISTYAEGLGKNIIDGKIFTTFNQTMTQTGRLSSSDPNLQNISIKSEEGRQIRKAFRAPDGYKFVSADYSQVELRMLAHMADEQVMIDAFNDGVDIHNQTASVIFNEKPDEVTAAQRRVGKTVNFAIIYGQTEFGLSQELGISRLEAKQFIKAYFASYPNIHRFTDSLVEFCKENGYVETLLHRRRAIPEISSANFMVREFGKRAAMNAPVQGSAADLIKIAMIKMDKAIKERNLKSEMLLQIHDELIFQVPDDELEEMEKLIVDVMDHAMDLKVPLEASVNDGQSWYEAK